MALMKELDDLLGKVGDTAAGKALRAQCEAMRSDGVKVANFVVSGHIAAMAGEFELAQSSYDSALYMIDDIRSQVIDAKRDLATVEDCIKDADARSARHAETLSWLEEEK